MNQTTFDILLDALKALNEQSDQRHGEYSEIFAAHQTQMQQLAALADEHKKLMDLHSEHLIGVIKAMQTLGIIMGSHPALRDLVTKGVELVLADPSIQNSTAADSFLRVIQRQVQQPHAQPKPEAPTLTLIRGGRDRDAPARSTGASAGSPPSSPESDQESDRPDDPPPPR